MDYIELRASSLPGYTDCPRRAAARMFKPELAALGHDIAPARSSVSASIGTALHSMMADLLRRKQAYGSLTPDDITIAVDGVRPAFESELASEVIWDQTTPHLQTAFKQLRAMAGAFLPIARHVEPLFIEQAFTKLVNPVGGDATPVLLTGHLDVMDVRNEIHDHKTGVKFPSCHAQLGAYAMLAEYNGHEVSNVRVNFVQRLGVTKLDQAEAQTVRLPLEPCMSAAWSTIKQFQLHYLDWVNSREPEAFPANPVSMMCTPKYCPAYGTSFCQLGEIPQLS